MTIAHDDARSHRRLSLLLGCCTMQARKLVDAAWAERAVSSSSRTSSDTSVGSTADEEDRSALQSNAGAGAFAASSTTNTDGSSLDRPCIRRVPTDGAIPEAQAVGAPAAPNAVVLNTSSSRSRPTGKEKRRRPVTRIGEMIDRLAEFEDLLQATGSQYAACATLKCAKGTIDAYSSKLQQLHGMGIDVQNYKDVKLTELALLLSTPAHQQLQMHAMSPQLRALTIAVNQSPSKSCALKYQLGQQHEKQKDKQGLVSSTESSTTAGLPTGSSAPPLLYYPLAQQLQQLQHCQLIQPQLWPSIHADPLPHTSSTLADVGVAPPDLPVYYKAPATCSALPLAQPATAQPSPLHAQLCMQLQEQLQLLQAYQQAQFKQQQQNPASIFLQPLPPPVRAAVLQSKPAATVARSAAEATHSMSVSASHVGSASAASSTLASPHVFQKPRHPGPTAKRNAQSAAPEMLQQHLRPPA